MKRVVEPEIDPLDGDLSEVISQAQFKKTLLTYAPKDSTVTLRVPQALVDKAKAVAKKKGVKYQRLMRDALADFLVREGG
jgi:predicted DNA binding CopG/RHH family protein